MATSSVDTAIITWTVHKHENCASFSMVRDFPRVLKGASGSHSSTHSKLEQNGLHAVVLLCFDHTGLCTEHSTALFPTKLARPADVRGYLKTPLILPQLSGVPTDIRYDGVAFKITYSQPGPRIVLSVFVSPSRPIVWLTVDYDAPQVGASALLRLERTLVFQEGPCSAWRAEKWVTEKRREIAFTCSEDDIAWKPRADQEERRLLVAEWTNAIQLQCPSHDLEAAIYFAKIRVSEAVFDAPKLGTVHSPGGGMYYSGVWCNDQAEYAAPVLGMLGGTNSKVRFAATESLKTLAKWFDIERSLIPYSIEIDGGYIGLLDRGDAGMFAWGASCFMLATADSQTMKELFPHVRFACDIILKKMKESKFGIVASESDELEGRFSTGHANLSANCISILALRVSAEAALSVGESAYSQELQDAATLLLNSADTYFQVEDRRQYEYFSGCDDARGWACLSSLCNFKYGDEALVFALTDLWTDDGVLTSSSSTDVWDRCTLYAIRAAYIAGMTELATVRLLSFAGRRLKIGPAAPCSTEENTGFAQLSGESGLLIRTVTEGLLGISVRSGKRVHLRPRFPPNWSHYAVRNIYIAGECLSICLELKNGIALMSVDCGNGSASLRFSPGSMLVVEFEKLTRRLSILVDSV